MVMETGRNALILKCSYIVLFGLVSLVKYFVSMDAMLLSTYSRSCFSRFELPLVFLSVPLYLAHWGLSRSIIYALISHLTSS